MEHDVEQPRPSEWRKVMKLGDAGADVSAWRFVLQLDDFDLTGPSHIFDPSVHNATVAWQTARGLKADGVVGEKTRAAINVEVIARPQVLFDPRTVHYIEAANWQRDVGAVEKTLIVLHSMEAAEAATTADNVAAWFAGQRGPAPQTSAHYCLTPETRVLFDDLRWRPIGDVRVGTRLVSTQEHCNVAHRTLQMADVTAARFRQAECLRVSFEDGREVTCSRDHRWLTRHPVSNGWHWRAAEVLEPGAQLLAPMRPWSDLDSREAGYIAGIFDGEGCWSGNRDLSFAQKGGLVLEQAHAILRQHGIPFRQHRRDGGVHITDLSGLQATMQALGQFRPQRLAADPRWLGRSLQSRIHPTTVRIAEVEPAGICEVMSIETTTHTFFAEGIVSHNCIDADSVICCVPPERIAWHAPGANRRGIGIELAGYARQTRAQWLDDFSLRMLMLAAELTAYLCERFGIPVAFIGAEHVKRGAAGITTHAEVTKAFPGKGTHWDPGPHFPVSEYLRFVTDARKRLPG